MKSSIAIARINSAFCENVSLETCPVGVTTLLKYSGRSHSILSLSAIVFLAVSLWQAAAQPTLVSVVPADAASGVSPTASVVFTFSTAMDTNSTAASFLDQASQPVLTIPTWNSSSNILTCAPSPTFPSPQTITWFVVGQDPNGLPLNGTGFVQGSFSTGSGTTGSGTNATTTFSLDKFVFYDQTNSAAPTLNPTVPYGFDGTTALSSNRTATNITLTLPNAAVSNLTQNIVQHEDWYLFYSTTVSNAWATNFPDGTYQFKVTAPTSNQTVSVLFSAMNQPNGPHVTNYTAAQSINPTQPFALGWDPFVGGGSTDYVFVAVGGGVWQSPTFGAAGALRGTAISVTIPANSLQANSNYTATIGFYHAIVSSNANYATIVVRATVTQFNVATTGSAGPPAPIIANPTWTPVSFNFDILTSPGQILTVVSSTNVHTPLISWPVLLTTTSSVSTVHISDPHSSTNKALYYRARNGL
jgi:hypothetical protein